MVLGWQRDHRSAPYSAHRAQPQERSFRCSTLAAPGLSVPELAKLLGYTPRGLRASPDSKYHQPKLGEWVGLLV